MEHFRNKVCFAPETWNWWTNWISSTNDWVDLVLSIRPDYYLENPPHMPKAEIWEYVRESWFQVPKIYHSLDELLDIVENWWSVFFRSEHPKEYDWASWVLNSFWISFIKVEKPIKITVTDEEIEKRKPFELENIEMYKRIWMIDKTKEFTDEEIVEMVKDSIIGEKQDKNEKIEDDLHDIIQKFLIYEIKINTIIENIKKSKILNKNNLYELYEIASKQISLIWFLDKDKQKVALKRFIEISKLIEVFNISWFLYDKEISEIKLKDLSLSKIDLNQSNSTQEENKVVFEDENLNNFYKDFDYSYWEYIKWRNITITADSWVKWKYYIFFDEWSITVKDWNIISFDIRNKEYEQSLFLFMQNVPNIIDTYESIRKLEKFNPWHCPIMEFQIVPNEINTWIWEKILWLANDVPYIDLQKASQLNIVDISKPIPISQRKKLFNFIKLRDYNEHIQQILGYSRSENQLWRPYFLQYHRCRDFKHAWFVLDREPEEWEIECKFVRLITPPEWLVLSYRIKEWMRYDEESEVDIYNLAFPLINNLNKKAKKLRLIILWNLYKDVKWNHWKTDTLIKPEVSIAIDDIYKLLWFEKIEFWKHINENDFECKFRIISDWNRAFIKLIK